MTSKTVDGLVADVEPTYAVHVIAVTHVLDEAERMGRALSKEAHAAVEEKCNRLFNYRENTTASVVFSRTLKEIAIRLFRQQRYREADARYRLAARFNPADPTLVSNRATCMYNLSKYQTCINLCNTCLEQFPDLHREKPMLYLKIMNRTGQANIELNNFVEARATYEALYNLKNSKNPAFKLDIPDKEFNQVLFQYQAHLNARAGDKAVGQRVAATPMRGAKSHGMNRVEEEIESEDMDENINGVVEVGELCCHVNESSKTPCRHPYPDMSYFENSDESMREEEIPSASDSDASCPTLVSSSAEDNDDDSEYSDDQSQTEGSAESDMPQLLSDEDEASDDMQDENENNANDSDGDQKSERDDGALRLPTVVKRSSNGHLKSSKGKKSTPAAKKTNSIDWTRAWKRSETEEKNKARGAGAATSSTGGKADKDGFKRGFLEKAGLVLPNYKEFGQRITTVSNKWKAACYETDEEVGPVGSGMLVERIEEDKTLQEMRKTVMKGRAKSSFDVYLSKLLCELMGKSFPLNRAVDFSRLFGQHVVVSSGGKRKKKSCDANCGTCFARKMWKERFIPIDREEAIIALLEMEKDPRRDERTFLPGEQWHRTGYYGSGHELAYDLSALIHGVAYVCQLQAELYWRDGKLSLQKDMQYRFITALSNAERESSNLAFIFRIFCFLRDTVNLFAVFPDFADQGLPLSFQFQKGAANAARGLLKDVPGSSESVKTQAVLTTKSSDLVRNAHSWAVLGQVTKDEEWVYGTLLRDVSHLLTKLTTKVKRPPEYLQVGNSFSEAFEKACGQHADNEKYWKLRAVTIVYRERSRAIERAAYEAKESKDWDLCELLYSHALTVRPMQARLHLRMARIRMERKEWQAALEDVSNCLTLIRKDETAVTSRTCSSPGTCLLLDAHLVYGDIYYNLSQESNELEKVKYAKAAAQSYRNAQAFTADNINSISKVLRTKLKIAEKHCLDIGAASATTTKNSNGTQKSTDPTGDEEAAKHAEDLLAENPSPKKTRRGKGRRRKGKQGAASSSDSKQKDATIPQMGISKELSADAETRNESSSSEEESSVPFTNSRFGVLLDDNSTLASNAQPKPRPTSQERTQDSSIHGWETVGKRPVRPTQSNITSQSSASTRVRNVTTARASSSSSPPQPSRHVRGRRYRANMDASRGAEVTNGPSQPIGAGPTIEEAATEAERAIVILGGEARPIDVISRMNFSRWGINDVNAYLIERFGGLLQLCKHNTGKFQLRSGEDNRIMIVLSDRAGFIPLAQRNAAHAAHRAARDRANRQTCGATLEEVLRGRHYQPRQEQGITSVDDDDEECKICLDKRVDTKIIPCGHKWCDDCIMANMQRDRYTCPFCQQPIERLENLRLDD